MTGNASIFGIAGDLTYTGLAVAADHNVSEYSDTHEANVVENKNGNGELIGLYVSDQRNRCTITFFPDSTTLDGAKGAMKFPSIPSKVTLSNFPDTASPSLGINGDWVYVGNAQRSHSEGQARFTLPLFKPLSGPYSGDVDGLVTSAT